MLTLQKARMIDGTINILWLYRDCQTHFVPIPQQMELLSCHGDDVVVISL